jgi:hypothetical protein
VSLVQSLQYQNEDLFNRIPYALAIMTGVSSKCFHAFQNLAICVDEFQGEVEGEE